MTQAVATDNILVQSTSSTTATMGLWKTAWLPTKKVLLTQDSTTPNKTFCWLKTAWLPLLS